MSVLHELSLELTHVPNVIYVLVHLQVIGVREQLFLIVECVFSDTYFLYMTIYVR